MTVGEAIKWLEQFPDDAQLIFIESESKDRTLLMAFKNTQPVGDTCLYQTTFTQKIRERALRAL